MPIFKEKTPFHNMRTSTPPNSRHKAHHPTGDKRSRKKAVASRAVISGAVAMMIQPVVEVSVSDPLLNTKR